MRLRALLVGLLAPWALAAALWAGETAAGVPRIDLPTAPLASPAAATAPAGLAVGLPSGVPTSAVVPDAARVEAARTQAGSIVAAAQVAARHHLAEPTPARLLTAALIGVRREQGPSAGSPIPAIRQLRAWAHAASGLTIEADEAGAARVAAVRRGSPAEQAGLRPGDLLRGVGGASAKGLSPAAVRARLSRAALGSLSVDVERAGILGGTSEWTTELKTGERGTLEFLTRLLARLEPESLRPAAESGLERMLGRLDPYSAYLSPEAGAAVTAEVAGAESQGLGVLFDPRRPGLLFGVIAGGPAAEAGLRRGDRVAEAGGRVIDSNRELAEGLKSSGDGVPLVIERGGSRLRVTVRPRGYYAPTATAQRLDHAALYVRIEQFTERTPEDFVAAVNAAMAGAGRPRAVVIDLRGNPGGAVSSALKLAGVFIAKGQPIARQIGRTEEQGYVSVSGRLSGIPLAVLLDEHSASSSELLSAALKDQAGAVLVGRRSFGKDVGQAFFRLANGGLVKLTTMRFEGARGTSARGDGRARGLAPDVEVPASRRTEAGLMDTYSRAISGEPVRPAADPDLSAALAALEVR